MPYTITTTNPQRAERWLNLFGTDHLPIIGKSARWQLVEPGKPEIYAFDLDTTQLTPAGLDNFVRYVAEKRKLGKIARAALPSQLHAYPIPAKDCVIVAPDVGDVGTQTPPLDSISHSTHRGATIVD